VERTRKSRAEKEQDKRNRRSKKLKKRIVITGIVIILLLSIYFWYGKDSFNFSGGNQNRITEKNGVDDPENLKDPDTSDVSQGNENSHVDKSTNDSVENREPEPVLEQEQIKLAFVGDIMLGSRVETLLEDKGYDYPYLHVKDFLQRADITMANLETPISDRGEPEDKTYAYRTSPKVIPDLVESGIDVLNLANNHILDYGLQGMLDTFDHLDQAGLKRIGAGKDVEEAYAPVVIEKYGMKIAFFGFSQVVPELWWKADKDHPGVAETYNYTRPVEAIESVRSQVDLIVVTAHWGNENIDTPDKRQTEMAYRYIDAGADLVIGGHPHVLQSIESYKGKWIAYSLGNFIFTTNEKPLTWETVILEASCSREGQCDIQLIPIFNMYAQPKPMDKDKAEDLFARITDFSIKAEILPDGFVRRLEND
jgi:poly-gamma-glutamate capsule biosynthesis protein CapA/YwtB (metallophosphatase superfamily)